MIKKILFVTTENLPTNPRLVKELGLAEKNGIKADCLLFSFPGHWSDAQDHVMVQRFQNVHFRRISAGRDHPFYWTCCSAVWLFFRLFRKIFPGSMKICAYASNKRAFQLAWAMPHRGNHDLVIAHNPGVIYPAWQYARKHHIPFAVDVEDYYPGESLLWPKDRPEIEFRKRLLAKILPECSYVSFAAPLYRKKCRELCRLKEYPESWTAVLNTFPEDEFQEPVDISSDRLEVVWFSQNISFNRGLDALLPAFAELSSRVHLTLIGNLNREFQQKILAPYGDKFTILPAMPQAELHGKLSGFDIGLACEIVTDENHDLCLANKIFAYLQAGLFVLASDTQGQRDFLNSCPGHGCCYGNGSFLQALTGLCDARDAIRRNRNSHQKEIAMSLSWENESAKLIRLWNKVIR